MASATWLRLLKLDLALLVSAEAAPPKQPPRRPRLRLAAERLEDRTVPSGGPHLLGPADNHPPAPSPQGPAAHGPPSAANNDNGQGQNNAPPPHGTAAHGSPAANNGNGQGNNNDQGEDNSPSPQGATAHGPPSPANNGKGPGQNNAPPGPAANSQGNGNGQGEGEQNTPPTPVNGPGKGNSPPSPGPAANGQEDNNGQGNENGPIAPSHPFVSPTAPAPSGNETESAGFAAEPSAAGALAEALLAEESITLGAFAAEGESAASPPRGGSPTSSAGEDERVSVPEVGSGASGGGTPLLIASFNTPSGAFAAYVTGLQAPSEADDFKSLAISIPVNDLDRLFIEWWDDDQLLFPGAMPAIDETLFPETMPQLDDLLLPDPFPVGEDSYPGLEQISLAPAASPSRDLRAEAIGNTPRFAMISRLVPANDGLQNASSSLDAAEEPEPGQSLRPYHIALGMMPFLAAFGYTPSSLREHVRRGRQVWKRFRGYLGRKP